MKAKLKAAGAYFDVEEVNAEFIKNSIPFVRYFTDDEGNIYDEQQLEFLPDTADKVIEGWLCKEKDIEDTIMLHEDEPHLEWQPLPDSYSYESYGKVYWLPDIFSPDLTYENSPKRVKITIAPMEL